MTENNNEQQQIKIELKPEVAQGEYSNLAMINHASSEFVIDFAHMLVQLSCHNLHRKKALR